LLAEEVLATITNQDDRAFLIGQINRLSGFIGDRREQLNWVFCPLRIPSDNDLLERTLTAATSPNVSEFIEQLNVVDRNMDGDVRSILASSDLLAGAGSGSARVQGTPFGRPSTSSGESASDAAVAVTRGPDPAMARIRAGPGDNTQDANAITPLPRRVATMNLEAAGAAAAADGTQPQAVIDGAATVTAAAAAADSDDDSAPADSRKRQHSDADDDRKPPAQ
jgi:hypothetical protein